MKRLCGSLFFTVLFLCAGAQKYSFTNLLGRWESAEGPGIEFVDSAHVYLLYKGEKKQVASFYTDFSKNPVWFDFTVQDSGESISMKSLLLLVNENLIQWQVFEGDRPQNFTADKGTMVYLRRKR